MFFFTGVLTLQFRAHVILIFAFKPIFVEQETILEPCPHLDLILICHPP